MRRLRAFARGAALVVLVLLGVLVIIAGVFRSWSRAQVDAAIVLAITEQTPLVAPLVRWLTDEPRIDDVLVAGQPTTLARPGQGDGPWPAIVFVNGATRLGRHHPQVQRLAQGLARAGFLVAVPELPGLRLGEITPATTEAATRVASAVARRPDTRHGSISFYGVSVGATLALLAAEEPALAGRVRAVGGEAPWVDLKKVIRLVTTGYYGRSRYVTDAYAQLAVARSLVAGLPQTRDRRRLLALLERVADGASRPLAPLRAVTGLKPSARALVSLLLNRDPRHFETLYPRLPQSLRRDVGLLSPLVRARRLDVPVELASSPHDDYFPPEESRSLERRSERVRVTVTSALDHALPRLTPSAIGDFATFDAFVVRFLRDAR